MNPNHLNAYEVLKEEELQDIHSKGWLLRHKKTGARVMLIENSDENKVFNIAFRTPPKNSTGCKKPQKRIPHPGSFLCSSLSKCRFLGYGYRWERSDKHKPAVL